MHIADNIEQGLYGRVNSNTTTPLGITAHAVYKYLHAAVQCIQELVRIFLCLTILISLQKKKQ